MRFKEIGPDVLARFKYDPQNPTGLAGQNPGAGNRPYHQVQLRGKSYKKKSRQREVVEAWLENKRQEIHGEFAKH